MTGNIRNVPLPLDPTDAQCLARVLAEAFTGRNPGWSADDLIALSGQAGVCIHASVDGALIMRSVLDEAEILTIGIRPSARRQGRARALLTKALAELAAQGVHRIFLEVADNNLAARAVYSVVGFRETGRRRSYYLDEDGTRLDAVLMDMSLDC